MTGPVLLAAQGLSISVGAKPLLQDVSFTLRAGESLTLLGESGAGKSLLAQAVMGTLPAALLARGRITLNGITSKAAEAGERRAAWGRELALLPQEPALALDPLRRLTPQLAEVHALVRRSDTGAARNLALRELEAAGLLEAAHKYPWQLSGGMAQRAAAVIALAGGARILLVDEPTKGLDAHWRDRALDAFQAVQRDGGCVVAITHDLRVAQALGGQLVVLREGRVVEQGDMETVLANPQHAFTRQLVKADPAHWPRALPPMPGAEVLRAQGVSKSFGGQRLFEDVSLSVRARERLVIQGPSGTGKSTLGNLLLGLLKPDKGHVQRAQGLPPHALQKLYQDPVASFAPQVSLLQSLRDVAARHGQPWHAVLDRLAGLRVAEDLLLRLPSQVSGGELQRIALARVLAVQPALLFADEPTSRLDPVSQQEAVSLLLKAVEETHAALVLVTHDEDLAKAVGRTFLGFGALAV
jgi:peptide/nickel transport system ATP-binding protein